MTYFLEGVTDAHLQAALDAAGYTTRPSTIRSAPLNWCNIIAHARQIAENERLAAELAELRAKYEPDPVDPVKVEACALVARHWPTAEALAEACIRRGMEMQPAPFTRDEAERIAQEFWAQHNGGALSCVAAAITTPHAELRAMLGDGL